MKIVTMSHSIKHARAYKGHLVYIMRHKTTGEYYVGHTGDFDRRYSSMPKDKWMSGYSLSDFEFKFVECDVSEAKEIANVFIDKYDSIKNGLNKVYAPEPSGKKADTSDKTDNSEPAAQSVVVEAKEQNAPVILYSREGRVDLIPNARRIVADGVLGIFVPL